MGGIVPQELNLTLSNDVNDANDLEEEDYNEDRSQEGSGKSGKDDKTVGPKIQSQVGLKLLKARTPTMTRTTSS
eukprot:11178057-Ditylum_brightwellii.AAC.1